MEQTSPPHNHPPSEREIAPAVRLCLAVDIEQYNRFTDLEAERAQGRFVEILRHARARAGLQETHVDVREAGDAQFVVFPPGVDESAVIPGILDGLSDALRHSNADLNERARLRLRVAIHRGLLHRGPNGWIGQAAIAVHRLVDSTPLRAALARDLDASFALIVANTVYQDVIAHQYCGLLPTSFHETTVDIPTKRFVETAWIYLEACSHRDQFRLVAVDSRRSTRADKAHSD